MSNNKQQTAVDWLSETLRFTNKEAYAEIYDNINKAKEMEKKQIINAHNQGIWTDEYDERKYIEDTLEREPLRDYIVRESKIILEDLSKKMNNL
jgi:ribosomal protein S24E